MQLSEIEEAINSAEQMIGRNVIVEIEGIEQLLMSADRCPIIPASPLERLGLSIATKRLTSRDFFNGIATSSLSICAQSGRPAGSAHAQRSVILLR